MKVIINDQSDIVPKHATRLPCPGSFLANRLYAENYPLNALPAADWLRKLHGLEGAWQVMTPIRWHASHNDVVMEAEGERLGLDDPEARVLFESLAVLESPDGPRFFRHDRTIWLVQYPAAPVVNGPPPSQLVHTSLALPIQALGEGGYWQRLLTEIQMLWHHQPLANGVWVWGGGAYTGNRHSGDVMVVENPGQLAACQAALAKYHCPITWFWNNLAYRTPKRPFWKRWRKTHDFTD